MTNHNVAAGAPETRGDPVVEHSWREAKIILAMWLVSSVFSATYCYLNGYLAHPVDAHAVGPPVAKVLGSLESYDRDPQSLTMPMKLGVPDWVFFGVVLPWLICIGATFWFCLFVFQEDCLGDETDETDNE